MPERTLVPTRNVSSTSSPRRRAARPGFRRRSPNVVILLWAVLSERKRALKRYLFGQAEHHKTEDSKFELLRTLCVHGVAFDETYAFD
jgi:hypothetical protein